MRLNMTVPKLPRARTSAPARTEVVPAGSSDYPGECRRALAACGFTLEAGPQYFPDARVSVDLIATNRHAVSFYIVCRGGDGRRQAKGNRSHASAAYRRALATARSLASAGWGPSLLLTSYLPDTPRAHALLAELDPGVLFDVVNPLSDVRRLRWLANADERQLLRDLERRRRVFLGGGTARAAPRGRAARPLGQREQTRTA